MQRVRQLFLILLIALSAGIAAAEDIPLPRPRPGPDFVPFAESARPYFDPAELTAAPSDCRLRLDMIAVVEAVPRLIGPGECGGIDVVRLRAVLLPDKTSIALNPPPELRCTMAEKVATWIRDEVAPMFSAAGPPLHSIENYNSYECRGRNRVFGARLSEHGKGNALDIRRFKLADGKSVEPTDVNVAKEFRETMRQQTCARFMTVLGPGSDGYHESHIHIDLAERNGGFRLCQWDVREPPPPPAPPPAPEVALADAPLPPNAEVVHVDVPLPQPRPALLGALHRRERGKSRL